MRPENSILTSITSIIRSLVAATALSALLASAFGLFGRSAVAIPFLLATAIGFGLIVVSVAWRAIVRAHPEST
jgi:hypothetical protein